jgi:NTE family protein
MDQETSQPALKPTKVRPKKIGIGLSGGGYRAALFHLGVLRALHESRILAEVETVSSVSGGSILAGYLAVVKSGLPEVAGLQFDDWESRIARPFRSLMTRDVRTGPIIKHLLWNWAFPNLRFRNLAENIGDLLKTGASGETTTLKALPESPNFVFCASDLVHGVNWEFTRERVGSYCSKYAKIPDLELSVAVAASASFPPVFGPYTFDFTKYRSSSDAEKNKFLKRMMLSDGGVYDNLGFEPILKTHSEIYLSDGGKPFAFSNSALPWARYSRFFSVMMNQVADLRRRQFFADLTEGRFKGSFVTIDGDGRDCNRRNPSAIPVTGPSGYAESEVLRIIAIRTDLDRFSDAESRILENHGYCTMAGRLKSKQAARIPAGVTLENPPHPDWLNAAKVQDALSGSHRRLSVKRFMRMT